MEKCIFRFLPILGLPLITYAPRERGGGSSLLYISIAYYMQKKKRGGGSVQIACKNAYVINGRPLSANTCILLDSIFFFNYQGTFCAVILTSDLRGVYAEGGGGGPVGHDPFLFRGALITSLNCK